MNENWALFGIGFITKMILISKSFVLSVSNQTELFGLEQSSVINFLFEERRKTCEIYRILMWSE